MKLKIYLNSSSTFTLVQMFDFVACADDYNFIKIVSWYRTPLGAAALSKVKAVNTIYLPQISHVTREYINKILIIVGEYNPESIEIHANIYFSHVESYRIICSLAKVYPLERIRLHLYDDGVAGITERTSLNLLRESEYFEESKRNTELLLQYLHNDVNPFSSENSNRWPLLRYYSWHNIVATTYHILSDRFTCHNDSESVFISSIAPYCDVFDFNKITPKALATCLCLLNIDYNLFVEIKNKLLTPGAILFTGTGNFERSHDNQYADRQIMKIKGLRSSGIIGDDCLVIFKPHPSCHQDNIKRITKCLGDDVYVMPSVIPFELFTMAGIIPQQIVGVFSTLMLLVPEQCIKYIIFDANNKRDAMENKMLSNLISCNIVRERKVFGWLD